MTNLDSINFDEYANVLHRAISNCDTEYRKKFLIYSFRLLKNLFEIEQEVELDIIDCNKNPMATGEFRITKSGYKILVNSKFIKTDASANGYGDMFTRIAEMNNDWRYPLTILSSLCHEFKHCYDYFHNQLFAFKKSKLKEIEEPVAEAIYYLNPSEKEARKYELNLPKKILTKMLDSCQNTRHEYLKECIENKMLPAINKAIQRLETTENTMTERLENMRLNIKDYCTPYHFDKDEVEVFN